MFRTFRNAAGFVVATAILTVGLTTASFGVEESLDAKRTLSLALQAKAIFIPAVSVTVEHEVFRVVHRDRNNGKDETSSHSAYIRVKGIQGETAILTCGIETHRNGVMRGSHTSLRRDCDGSSVVRSSAVMSGHGIEKAIVLTRDLLPTANSRRVSDINIMVSYI